MKDKPQLSAEQYKKYAVRFCNCNEGQFSKMATHSQSCDFIQGSFVDHQEQMHFLATALEEQRQELLSEVESWLDEMPGWIKIEGKYGYYPIHNKADISPFRQELRAKLNQLKGEK